MLLEVAVELGAREEAGRDERVVAVTGLGLWTSITLDTPDPRLDTERRDPGALRCSRPHLHRRRRQASWSLVQSREFKFDFF